MLARGEKQGALDAAECCRRSIHLLWGCRGVRKGEDEKKKGKSQSLAQRNTVNGGALTAHDHDALFADSL